MRWGKGSETPSFLMLQPRERGKLRPFSPPQEGVSDPFSHRKRESPVHPQIPLAKIPLAQRMKFQDSLYKPSPHFPFKISKKQAERVCADCLCKLFLFGWALFWGGSPSPEHWNFWGWTVHNLRFALHGLAFQAALDTGTPVSTAPCFPASQFTVCTSRFTCTREFHQKSPLHAGLCNERVLDFSGISKPMVAEPVGSQGWKATK